MLLLVGLGNPGSNYTNTRHNIGFKIIDAINAHFTLSKQKQKFSYTGMPHIKPLPIKTKGKGFWKAIVMWLLSTRNWELTQDWKYNIDGTDYVIPKGFTFDGCEKRTTC